MFTCSPVNHLQALKIINDYLISRGVVIDDLMQSVHKVLEIHDEQEKENVKLRDALHRIVCDRMMPSSAGWQLWATHIAREALK